MVLTIKFSFHFGEVGLVYNTICVSFSTLCTHPQLEDNRVYLYLNTCAGNKISKQIITAGDNLPCVLFCEEHGAPHMHLRI